MIYNMNTEVMRLLKSVSELKLCAADYPEEWSTFPAAIYHSSHDPVQVDANQIER